MKGYYYLAGKDVYSWQYTTKWTGISTGTANFVKHALWNIVNDPLLNK